MVHSIETGSTRHSMRADYFTEQEWNSRTSFLWTVCINTNPNPTSEATFISIHEVCARGVTYRFVIVLHGMRNFTNRIGHHSIRNGGDVAVWRK